MGDGLFHLCLCPRCGYYFWTKAPELQGYGHCLKPLDPNRSEWQSDIFPWLWDNEAIDYIACPEVARPDLVKLKEQLDGSTTTAN